jgi:hypothetical protein
LQILCHATTILEIYYFTSTCSGGNPADALSHASSKEEREALLGIMIEGTTTARLTELLHYVAAYCDRDIILSILQRGADIMAEDSEQRLPLEMAIAYKNSKCDFLLQKQYLHCCGASAGARETFFFFLNLQLPTAYQLVDRVWKQNDILVTKNKTKSKFSKLIQLVGILKNKN